MGKKLLVVLTLLLMTTPLVAQSTTAGGLSGTVTDSSGAALPGVTVELSGPAMQGTRTVVSDASGNYRFVNVPPGENYKVTANLSGFAPATKNIARVYLGQEGHVDITLRAAVAEAITVTAEAPLVDTTKTTTGVNVTARQFEALPAARTFQQLTTLAPGVTMEMGDSRVQTPNSPNVGASSAPENNYIIDGLSTTDPRYGISGANVTMNIVEEVQVMTGGYSAEYGRSTGGVFNVITKSGGNEFHGDVFGYYQDSSWSNERVRSAQKGTDFFANLSDRMDVGLSLGGPIMRDRVWFFASYNPARRTTFIGQTVGADGHVDQTATEFDTETDHYNGKLTWSVNPNHNIVLAAFGDPTTQEGWLGVANADPGVAIRTSDIGSNSYNLRYTGVFSPKFLGEASLGRYSRDNTLAPATDTGRNVPRQIDEDGTSVNYNFQYGGFQRFQADESTRDAWAIKLTNYFGGHELRYGIDTEVNEYSADLHETWFRYFGDVTRGGVTQDEIQERDYSVRGSGQTANSAFFLQDQWKVLPNFQMNLGVRYEEQKMESARGVAIAHNADQAIHAEDPEHADSFTLDNNWAPRLGLVWDPMNNGRSKVFASWGRFYEAIPLDINIRALNGEDYIISRWRYRDNSRTPENFFNRSGSPINADWTRTARTELLAATATALSADLKAQYQDEWIIGGEYQFSTFWSAGARYVDRQIKRVIEDFGVFSNPDDPLELTGYAIGNPGEGILGGPFEKPTRKYQALELTLQRAFANNWQLYSSFVYAKAEGNYEGLYMSGYEQLDPNILALYDIPSFLNNADGKLRADKPFQFKIHSSYRFPFGLTISEGLFVSDGIPISAQGPEIYNGYGDGTIFLQPRGSSGRTDMFWTLDLHADYALPLFQGTGRSLSFVIDIFNALDNDEVLEVDQDYVFQGMEGVSDQHARWFCDGSQAGPPCNGANNLDDFGNPKFDANLPASPYFGTPILYQAPRTVQIGVKFTY
jgi:outer membrane receptor protein involved in Fe transport